MVLMVFSVSLRFPQRSSIWLVLSREYREFLFIPSQLAQRNLHTRHIFGRMREWELLLICAECASCSIFTRAWPVLPQKTADERTKIEENHELPAWLLRVSASCGLGLSLAGYALGGGRLLNPAGMGMYTNQARI